MAQDIVPVELGLTEGDLVTLWAPRWREDGEEWEAFLGHGEDLYCFDEVAELAAFIRTVDAHDLADHPAWAAVTGLSAPELEPDEDHRYDLVGLPELAAGDPEGWALAELDDALQVVRSLADVCDLEAVLDVLDSTPGFARLAQGPAAFVGKEGAALWDEVGTVLAEKWDSVIDALDDVVFIPEVDEAALATARTEVAEAAAADDADDTADLDDADDADDAEDADADGDGDTDATGVGGEDDGDAATDADDVHRGDVTAAGDEEPEGFWAEVGIDPIRIITSSDDYVSLRCYLDDAPVFLGDDGRIDVFGSERALARHLADATDHDLAEVVTYAEVAQAATAGELEVEVSEDNTYVLTGLADDIEAGPAAIDRLQLELAVELFTDAADAADDDAVEQALAGSQPLGWLVTYVLEPDPTKLEPSPPFAAEAAAWRTLEEQFEARLRTH